MAVNKYFSRQVKSEQRLYEDLIIESIKAYGQNVFYMPRNQYRTDELLHEDIGKFNHAITLEMYIESTDGFEGDGNILGKFGLEIRDRITFVVAKSRWNKEIGQYELSEGKNNRPFEGDLIYLPLSNTLFEIKFVEQDKPFYQLQDLPVYRLTCEAYEYNHEEINTGIDEIDDIQNSNAQVIAVHFTNKNDRDFLIGEIVRNQNDVSAIISEVNEDKNVIYLSRLQGKFNVNDIIEGDLSGATITISEINNSLDKIFKNDNYADNNFIEKDAKEIIDFNENNPFGSY